ncbi:hypothetical protein ACNKHO_14845 [Shigella flexneri]
MHGHGKHILKQQTPLWLAQTRTSWHFIRRQRVCGDAALLVLIEVKSGCRRSCPECWQQMPEQRKRLIRPTNM